MNDADRRFLLYAQIVGIQHHPKNEVSARMTPRQCIVATDDYMREWDLRQHLESYPGTHD